ncbi:hypothetical protein HAX54_045709 [Datura stramonium]|uniref:Uncharacterized protein n=1 Tax=Datura stramonium TaxID=4076 RepID=A0ABS8WI48_DATST|nr:hypothetical protein [Datura stramonium]
MGHMDQATTYVHGRARDAYPELEIEFEDKTYQAEKMGPTQELHDFVSSPMLKDIMVIDHVKDIEMISQA